MNDKTIRAFIALDLSVSTKEYLAAMISGIKKTAPSNVKWVRTENLHITMKFLGDVEQEQLPLINKRLQEGTSRHAPFQTVMTGLGWFPSSSSAHVLWVGFDDAGGVLASLSKHIDAALNGMGFATEKRKFHTHATLARLDGRRNCLAWIKQISVMPAPKDCIEIFDHITLYQSTLTPQGTIYTPLKIFHLS